MNDLIEDFENAFRKLSNNKFLENSRPGGDMPYFILPYSIEHENTIDKQVENLQKRLQNEGLKILTINLYDASIDILKGKNGLEKMFQLETKRSKTYFLKALQSALQIQQVFMPYIHQKMEESQPNIIFITGVAAVFPYIRSHYVLNNLQNITGSTPMLMFYPGEYSGRNLKLFNLLQDDNYYRALNIKQFNI